MLICKRIFVFILLSIICWESSGITNKRSFAQYGENVRNFRHIAGSSSSVDFTEWEIGLRESVNQALLREGYRDPNLRERILRAPIIGKQNAASKFGDVVILARGQLFALNAGNFIFIQDPYSNDCDDCHNVQRLNCEAYHCKDWRYLHSKKLIGLWSVKRLRHRSYDNYQYEIQYTISPITPSVDEEFVRRNGGYDYAIPGHVFIIRQDNLQYNQPTEPYVEVYNKKHHAGHYKPDILLAIDQNGHKHFLHSYPGFFTSIPIHPTNNQDFSTHDPREIDLYKKLIESLSSKTSTTIKEDNLQKITFTESDAVTRPHYVPYLTTVKEVRPLTTIFVPAETEKVTGILTTMTPKVHTESTVPPSTTEYKTKVKTTFHYFVPIGAELMTEKEVMTKTMTAISPTEQYQPAESTKIVNTPSTIEVTMSSKTTNKIYNISKTSRPTTTSQPETSSTQIFAEKTMSSTTKNHKQELSTPGSTINIPLSSSFPSSPSTTPQSSTAKNIVQISRPMQPKTTSRPTQPKTTYKTTKPKTTAKTMKPKTTSKTTKPKTTSRFISPTSQSTRMSTTSTHLSPITRHSRPTSIKTSTTHTKPSVGVAKITKVTVPIETSKVSQKPSTYTHAATRPTSTETTEFPNSISTKPTKSTTHVTEMSLTVPTEILREQNTTSTLGSINMPPEIEQTAPVMYVQSMTSPMQISTEKTSISSEPTTQFTIPQLEQTTSPLGYTTIVPSLISKETKSQDISTTKSMESATTRTTYESTQIVYTMTIPETMHTPTEATSIVSQTYSVSEETTEEISPTMNLEVEKPIPENEKTTTEAQTKLTETIAKEIVQETSTEIKNAVGISNETYTPSITSEMATDQSITENTFEPLTKITTEIPTTIEKELLTTLVLETSKKETTTVSTIPTSTVTETFTNQTQQESIEETSIMTSTTDNFLSNGVSINEPIIYIKPIKQDYTDEDIFGSTKSTRKPIMTTPKKISDSDFALELFSNSKKNRKRTQGSSKIIFSNFYAASTFPTPSTAETSQEPLTRQSVETSISYEVNKRKNKNMKAAKPTNATTKVVVINDQKKDENNITETPMADTKEVFDLLALQLVNHARTIDYIHETKNRTSRPKYRRRKIYSSKLTKTNLKKRS